MILVARDAIDGSEHTFEFDFGPDGCALRLEGGRLYMNRTDEAYISPQCVWFVNIPSADEPSGPFDRIEIEGAFTRQNRL